jgi:formylglycine-generating enzyme required for sulfatase activity
MPGKLMLEIHPRGVSPADLTGLRVMIDESAVTDTVSTPLDLPAGSRRLRISANRHQDYSADLVIEGCGALQTHRVDLLPDWSPVTVNSTPAGATVAVDGKTMGATPLRMELAAGTYDVVLNLVGHRPWQTRLTVLADRPQVIQDVVLQPALASLKLSSTPSGATVLAGTRYVGLTPLSIALTPGSVHTLQLSKPGYQAVERQVTLEPGTQERLAVKLKARHGIVRFNVDPVDAILTVDGRKVGRPPASMRMLAVESRIEISKPGYETHHRRITPRPGFEQEIRVALKKKGAAEPASDGTITAANGYSLQLIRPRAFTMGSSRRQQGRRSNETLRKIDLTRPFYMGVTEVTNAQFKQFLSEHRSGALKRHTLSGPRQPVVRVTWEQAALFCNWLSARESLSPVYKQSSVGLVAANPMGNGYRLPTEAEWEYCARFRDNRVAAKYPWGNRFPPPDRAGNFADQSAQDLLATPLSGYNDGYAVSAPTGQFAASPLGLHDLGGNVAEWCHDYYSIYSYKPGKIYVNPVGPAQGRHRIVRGSSFKHAGISELRSAFRDYSDDKRDDLGFRVCRYVQ